MYAAVLRAAKLGKATEGRDIDLLATSPYQAINLYEIKLAITISNLNIPYEAYFRCPLDSETSYFNTPCSKLRKRVLHVHLEVLKCSSYGLYHKFILCAERNLIILNKVDVESSQEVQLNSPKQLAQALPRFHGAEWMTRT